jgi:hypothetical protein
MNKNPKRGEQICRLSSDNLNHRDNSEKICKWSEAEMLV